jgi:arabinofuranosyltransferase
MTDRRSRALEWAPLVVAAGVLVWHSLQFDFVTDDAYISFVYSRNLAEHGQLTFNLGDRVEGSTSFLWTFVLGVLMLLGIEPEVSSRVLGTACAIGTLAITYKLMRRLGVGLPWAWLPAFLLAASSGFACWSSGGLETQLFTLLVVAAVDAYVAAVIDPRAFRRMGILLALAAMTRPEGLVVTAVIGLHRVAVLVLIQRRWKPTVDDWIALASFAAVWAPWFAWRWWYYGWFFPNTYYVKATGAWANPKLPEQMRDAGFYYVWVWLQQTRLVWALPVAALGLVAAWPARTAAGTPSPRFVAATLLGALGAVYLAYTISVGGDFMGLHRFIMPVFVVAAIAVALGLDRLDGWLRRARPVAIAYAVAAAVVAGFGWTQLALTTDSLRWKNFAADRGLIDTPAYLIAYTEDRAAIGRAMAPCFRPDDFSIVGGAGAQPYYGRMRAIDVFGLVSDRVAHKEKRIRARPGHTKFAQDATLDTYHPTFVFSCYALHDAPAPPPIGRWTSPCNESHWLKQGFEKVTMHIPALRAAGPYYTFFARKDRSFQCPGRVP